MDHDGKWKPFVSPAVRRARKHGSVPDLSAQGPYATKEDAETARSLGWTAAQLREDRVRADIRSAPVYTLQAGRLIVRDGVPLATLHGARAGYDPVEVDELVVQIVKLLNE